MSTSTVMIIGAAEEHCLGIRAVREMGLHVFVTDGRPDAPGFLAADGYAVASTYDYEGTLRAAQDYISAGGRVDGVMTLAADVPYTVAYVAERLGLPGIGTASAANASEKVRMKQCFERESVPMPLFREVADQRSLAQAAAEFGFPVVVKPVDSRGARGVQLVRSRANLPQAFAEALAHTPSRRVMVEQYLAGPQLSTEGCMIGGEAHIPAVFDRNYEFLERYAPFVVENGGEMPSVHAEQYRDEISTVMQQAALALGIETGVVKGDLVIHDGRVKVIEIAARLSGGFFGTVATPASCGVDLVRANIELCLGMPLAPERLKHQWERAAAIRFAFPPPGCVQSVSGLDTVRRDPACRYAHVFVRPGDTIQPITNHPGRPAVVVADGSDLGAAVSAAKRLIGEIRWEIGALCSCP